MAPIISTFGSGSARGFGRAQLGKSVFESFTFQGLSNDTPLVGYLGPTYSGLMGSTTYAESPFANNTDLFDVTTTGIQVWTVPEDANYSIEANSPGGVDQGSGLGHTQGVRITGTVSLTAGRRVYLLPGHPGNPDADGNSSSPGSGGTFLVMVPVGYESNPTQGLGQVTLSDVLIVCGGGQRFNDGFLPGNHPSGFDTEDATPSSHRYGSGRGAHFGNVSGPSGGAGLFLPAFEHGGSNDEFEKTWNFYDDATSYAFVADSFVTGGLGGKGYLSNEPTPQSDNGLFGSGGFGGGGGQSTGNSYSSGSGGMMGGHEMAGPNEPYPDVLTYSNTNGVRGAGSSYVNTNIVSNTTQSNVSSDYGTIKITKV